MMDSSSKNSRQCLKLIRRKIPLRAITRAASWNYRNKETNRLVTITEAHVTSLFYQLQYWNIEFLTLLSVTNRVHRVRYKYKYTL